MNFMSVFFWKKYNQFKKNIIKITQVLSIICNTICLQFFLYRAPLQSLGLFLLISSAFFSNQSLVNVVCSLLNAAKVETNTSFITEFTDSVWPANMHAHVVGKWTHNYGRKWLMIDIKTEYMVILLSSENSDDEALLLKTAVVMIERRAIPKIGSFVDIVLSYDYQEFRRNFRLSRGKYTIPLIFENSKLNHLHFLVKHREF